MRIMNVIVPILAAGALLAGDSNPPLGVDDGQRLFLANCAVCHGPDGDSVQGIDLVHGKLRRASSDDDMAAIIRNGIPGTMMPPNKDFSKYEAGVIVAYLRWIGSTDTGVILRGQPTLGKVLFEGKGECLGCHRVRDRGSRVGPDLTAIGSLRRAAELKQSILDPSAEVQPQNRFVRLVLRDGAVVSGRLLNHDTFTIQLIDSRDRLLSYSRSGLLEFAIVGKSPMPSYRDRLSEEELGDLIAYLASLKGVDKQ